MWSNNLVARNKNIHWNVLVPKLTSYQSGKNSSSLATNPRSNSLQSRSGNIGVLSTTYCRAVGNMWPQYEENMKANKEGRHGNMKIYTICVLHTITPDHNIRETFRINSSSVTQVHGKDNWSVKNISFSCAGAVGVLKYRNTKQCECFSFSSLAGERNINIFDLTVGW